MVEIITIEKEELIRLIDTSVAGAIEKAIHSSQPPQIMTTVSYTHLDVYKRQVRSNTHRIHGIWIEQATRKCNIRGLRR